jgi:uncharacterized membrane protein
VNDAPKKGTSIARMLNELGQMRRAFVPHAVFSHFPAALIPTAVFFHLLFLLTGQFLLELVGSAVLLVAGLSVPLTLVTGVSAWKSRFGSLRAPIFLKKNSLARALLLLCWVAILWRWLDPQVLTAGGLPAVFFFLLELMLLACVILLGHYGGVLVFGARPSQ